MHTKNIAQLAELLENMLSPRGNLPVTVQMAGDDSSILFDTYINFSGMAKEQDFGVVCVLDNMSAFISEILNDTHNPDFIVHEILGVPVSELKEFVTSQLTPLTIAAMKDRLKSLSPKVKETAQ